MDSVITRRAALAGLGLLAAAAAGACGSGGSNSSGTTTSAAKGLDFDASTFTEKTTTITTAGGASRKVAYRFYGPITYVAKSVDAKYQSLVISVPTSIDGKSVDARNAPIVFANSVGGYMPASVADSTGVGESQMTGMGGGTSSTATTSTSAAPSTSGTEVQSGGNSMLNGMGKMVSIPQLALAEGFVVVEPGARGRSLTNSSGDYYGTAPAAIIDLKAAVRYLRHNKDRIPGNTDRIVSTGTSAGGALSALLGASGDSDLYTAELTALGAADASDTIHAAGAWCPITDLEHADMAYEFCWGANPYTSTIDAAVTKDLAAQFTTYQKSLNLQGRNGFGPLTADTYHNYLLDQYLKPSAEKYLSGLSETDRTTYLKANPFLNYTGGKATFTWDGFVDHVGTRKKPAPAFDAFDLSLDINNLFGEGTQKARHITRYSQDHDTTGLEGRPLATDTTRRLNQMNPMHHIAEKNPHRAQHWWIRLGTKDSDTSLTIATNLAASLSALGDQVNHLMYWDQGHGSNDDPADFLTWVHELA
ncbi:subtype B tannase [Nocardia macrotermitis]|uniref:BD-FAE-like domain-containing protein n=1 Tax=Nocardia macrotermitis TaxID=2585198 RepID=A0A7K0DD16_9NOCA|nr:subtype B tannase [Nocardia macrotermitis]MQY23597.1 hypothetical protein [Nocardia macrotermitis]